MADIIGAIAGAAMAAAIAGVLMLLRLVRLHTAGSITYLIFSLVVGGYFGRQYYSLLATEQRARQALNDNRKMAQLYQPTLDSLSRGDKIPFSVSDRGAREVAARFASAYGLESQKAHLLEAAAYALRDMRKQDAYGLIARSDFREFLRTNLPNLLSSRLSDMMRQKRSSFLGEAVILLLLGAGVSIIITLQRARRPPEVPFERPERLPA